MVEQREWTVEKPIRGPWLSIYNTRLNFAHCLVNDFIYTHSRIVHMCGGELDIKYKKNVWGGIYSDGGTYLVPLVYGTPHLSIAKYLYMSVCILCVCTAVLFLEFWKRRQFYLQYDWDMLGYETAEVYESHKNTHVHVCHLNKHEVTHNLPSCYLHMNMYICNQICGYNIPYMVFPCIGFVGKS